MQVLHADVDVELDVVDRNNKPPVWDANVYGPIHIKENVTVGTVVTSVKARFVCHDMTETRHVTCRAVPCSANSHFFKSFSLFLSLLFSFSSVSPFSFSLVLFFHFSFTPRFASHIDFFHHPCSPLSSTSLLFTRVSTNRLRIVASMYILISTLCNPWFVICHAISHLFLLRILTWCILRERKHVWLSAAR